MKYGETQSAATQKFFELNLLKIWPGYLPARLAFYENFACLYTADGCMKAFVVHISFETIFYCTFLKGGSWDFAASLYESNFLLRETKFLFVEHKQQFSAQFSFFPSITKVLQLYSIEVWCI